MQKEDWNRRNIAREKLKIIFFKKGQKNHTQEKSKIKKQTK